jgi:hypothetical protein
MSHQANTNDADATLHLLRVVHVLLPSLMAFIEAEPPSRSKLKPKIQIENDSRPRMVGEGVEIGDSVIVFSQVRPQEPTRIGSATCGRAVALDPDQVAKT